MISIEHKLSSLRWNAKHALEFHTLLDSCGSFSSEMTTKLRQKVDTLLVEPMATPAMQLTLKPQTLSIPPYLTEEDWGYINGTHSYHTKLSVLCKRAKSLGVQSAAEQTTKSIAATLLCGLSTLPEPAAMHQVVADVKLCMASTATQAAVPFVLKNFLSTLWIYPQKCFLQPMVKLAQLARHLTNTQQCYSKCH